MRFTTKQDIEAPLDFVYRTMSDFEAWERSAMRRGVEVQRTDKLTRPGPGMTWASRFSYRGKLRSIELRLVMLEQPSTLAFAAQSNAVEGTAKLDLMEMSARRTRVHVVVEVLPRSLAARLFLQSLRLARARVDRKFDQRVAQLASDIEARYLLARKI
jgi:hypothetical protein